MGLGLDVRRGYSDRWIYFEFESIVPFNGEQVQPRLHMRNQHAMLHRLPAAAVSTFLHFGLIAVILAQMKSIAVIEDNKDNRLLVRSLLSEFYSITEYETGFEAFPGLRNSTPDLILLDISLPGMDGLEVLALLKNDERLKKIPVIALTAHAVSGDREQYLAAGFNDYIAKPIIDDDAFLHAIERWLT
jgi:two-component system cell cycle response regulator DivK